MKETIEYDGLTLLVDFSYTPPEKRNYGHPDDRLPDVEEEFTINEVELYAYNQEEVIDLLKTKLKGKIDENI